MGMLPLILCNNSQQMQSLQLMDFLHQSVLTSLQFGQYRRAVWYLQAFSLACDKTFAGRNMEIAIQELKNHMRSTDVSVRPKDPPMADINFAHKS